MIPIGLRPARADELPLFAACEREPAVARFIHAYDLERHRREFADPAVRYLAIVNRDDAALGFILLRLEAAARVEFRRIVVARRGAGIGSTAVAALPGWCRAQYGTSELWLDVFADNAHARQLYRRSGWVEEREAAQADGRVLVIMTRGS